jgi:hypothetical protein
VLTVAWANTPRQSAGCKAAALIVDAWDEIGNDTKAPVSSTRCHSKIGARE